MKTAIAITLWFAAATSFLGVLVNLRRIEAWGDWASIAGALIGSVMTMWFTFAGWWVSANIP